MVPRVLRACCWCPMTGSISSGACVTCPQGSTTLAAGSNSSADCLACPPGTRSVPLSDGGGCEVGYYARATTIVVVILFLARIVLSASPTLHGTYDVIYLWTLNIVPGARLSLPIKSLRPLLPQKCTHPLAPFLAAY